MSIKAPRQKFGASLGKIKRDNYRCSWLGTVFATQSGRNVNKTRIKLGENMNKKSGNKKNSAAQLRSASKDSSPKGAAQDDMKSKKSKNKDSKMSNDDS